MVQINPNSPRDYNVRTRGTGNEAPKDKESKKPTLQNMNELYSMWRNTFSAGEKQQTKWLEQYVKNNNLNVDVENLKAFFTDYNERYGNMGGMAGETTRLKAFQDYIDNGYDPSKRDNEAKSLLNSKLELNKGKKSDVLKDYLDKLSDVEIEYQKNQSTAVELEANRAEADSISQIIRDNVERGFKTFSEYQKNQSTVVESETNRAEADSINQIIRDNVERGFKTFSG